ncbi:MAG: extracellular solute-binding protein [Clostridiales bacterium]|nr:extracellular solute-binding protein [Clostridiales bacterium]
MKKILALVLALMLALSAAAMADTLTDSGYPIVEGDMVTLEIAGPEPYYPDHDWNDSPFVTEIEKIMNVHIHYTPYSADAWPNQMTLMFATDELPDMLANLNDRGKMSYGQALKYGDEGYLMDFSQYKDIMPFMTEFFKNHPEYESYITTASGAIYGFPIMNVQGADSLSIHPLSWNTDWLKNLGLEIPKTRDELVEVLTAIRDKDADGDGDATNEIPYAGGLTNGDNLAQMVMWGYGIYSRVPGYAIYADDNGKLILGNMTDEYKEFVTFMRKLYTEGFYADDASVVTGDEIKERTLNNQYGVLSGAYSEQYVALQEERGKTVQNWIPTNSAFTANKDDARVTVLNHPVSSNINIVANASTEHPEVVARFLDYFFDEFGVGGDAALNGWAGVSFTPKEVMGTGITMFDVEEQRGDMDAWEYRSSVACWYQCFATMWCKVNSNWLVYDYVENKDDLLDMWKHCSIGNGNNWRAYCNEEDGLTFKTTFGPMPYTDAEATERATLYTDVKTYLDTMYTAFITGEYDIDGYWDTYVDTLKNMKVERLIEIEQAAYDRMAG